MSRVTFELDGISYTIEVERQGETLHIVHAGETFTVQLQPTAGPAPASVAASATAHAAAPMPARSLPSGAAAAPDAVLAPMTGTVREVKVAPGDAVTEGQLLLVMEAMKMDIEIVAPTTGIIAEVAVREGQSVVEAEMLARIGSGSA